HRLSHRRGHHPTQRREPPPACRSTRPVLRRGLQRARAGPLPGRHQGRPPRQPLPRPLGDQRGLPALAHRLHRTAKGPIVMKRKTLGLIAGAMLMTACGGGEGAPAGGSIAFTISGEVLALGGYSFPPASADDPAFVDGWEVKFTRVLVTVDRIKLSDNP